MSERKLVNELYESFGKQIALHQRHAIIFIEVPELHPTIC